MSRVLIVFNSPDKTDATVWDELMGNEAPKIIEQDAIYVLNSADYIYEDNWVYTKMNNEVVKITVKHKGDVEFAVLLHTKEPKELEMLRNCDFKQTLNITVQKFSTAISPIAYEQFIKSFCVEGTIEKFNLLWEEIKRTTDTQPHLITLYILCQGYLAANGGKELHGWNEIPDNLKEMASMNKDKVKEENWWEIIRQEQVMQELEKSKKDNAISKLLSEIESKKVVDENTVVAAYHVISKMLI